MDFIGNLPLEISLDILKYLSPEDLAQCSMVNSKWRELTNNNQLWKRLCIFEEFNLNEDPPVIEDLPNPELPCHYKRLYGIHAAVLQKWKDNSFNLLNLKNIIGTAYFSNGTVLGVMYWDGGIEVFDLKGPPRIVQSLPPLLPGYLITSTVRNEDYAVFKSHCMFICYKWSDGLIHFCGALYAIESREESIEIRWTDSSDQVVNEGTCDTFWDVKALVKDNLVLYVRQELALYFWSLTEGRCIGSVYDVKNPNCFVYKNHLFIQDLYTISLYNVQGKKLSSLEIGQLRYHIHRVDLQFNDFVILAVVNCVEGLSVLMAWTWRLRRLAQFEEKLHGVVIHPRLPAVIYLSQIGKHRCKCRLVMRDLRDSSFLWESPFPTSRPFGTIQEEFVYFNVIKEKYLLCIPRYESCFTSNERLLFNVKNGKKMYHITNEEQFMVNYSNNKLIEVTVYGLPVVNMTQIILYS